MWHLERKWGYWAARSVWSVSRRKHKPRPEAHEARVRLAQACRDACDLVNVRVQNVGVVARYMLGVVTRNGVRSLQHCVLLPVPC